MKIHHIILVLLLNTVSITAFAQTMGLNYQAVLRDNTYKPISNQSGTATVTVLNTANGTELYKEVHNPINTDQIGLFNLVIGKGSPLTGTFSTLDWSTGGRSVKVSISVGGNTYNFPASELQAVPYAKVAERTLQSDFTKGTGNAIYKTDGVVGIGTNTPNALTNLHVKNTQGNYPLFLESTQNINGIRMVGVPGEAWVQKSVSGLELGTQSVADGDVFLWPGNKLALTAKTNGNIGIGTSAPTSLLHLNSTSTSTPINLTNVTTGSTTNDGATISQDGNTLNITNREIGEVVLFSRNGPSFISIGNNRHTGINTLTPAANLHLDNGCCSQTTLLLTGSNNGSTVNDGALIAMENSQSYGTLAISNQEDGVIQMRGLSLRAEFTTTALAPGSDNQMDLGRSNARWKALWATNGTIQTSDARLKKNIKPLHYGLQSILKLNPVTYEWITNSADKPNIGFLAQEVEKWIPEIVIHEIASTKDSLNVSDVYGLKYAELTPVLVKAIQEQQAQIELLTQENALLKQQSIQSNQRLSQLEASLQKLTVLNVAK